MAKVYDMVQDDMKDFDVKSLLDKQENPEIESSKLDEMIALAVQEPQMKKMGLVIPFPAKVMLGASSLALAASVVLAIQLWPMQMLEQQKQNNPLQVDAEIEDADVAEGEFMFDYIMLESLGAV